MNRTNVRLERDGPIGLIVIDHPPANALNIETVQALSDAFDELEHDSSVKSIIVTGAGSRYFVAGADINEFIGVGTTGERGRLGLANRLFNRLERLPKPVIAAINGYALGGGCELAMACDIRVAAESVQLGQPEINLGIIPGWGGLQRLPRLIGRGRALSLLLTGDRIGAADALTFGLVNEVVPDDQLLERARAIALHLASKAPKALALTKQRVADGADEPIERAIEADENAFFDVLTTEDAQEGIAAFFEKREAKFQGR